LPDKSFFFGEGQGRFSAAAPDSFSYLGRSALKESCVARENVSVRQLPLPGKVSLTVTLSQKVIVMISIIRNGDQKTNVSYFVFLDSLLECIRIEKG
jgi:hypothetical protein